MDFGYNRNNVAGAQGDVGCNSNGVVAQHDDAQQTYAEDEQSTHHDEPVPLGRFSVNELRTRLRGKGLRVAGSKEELVQRLLHPEQETTAQIKNGIAHNLLTADYILRVGLIWVGIGEKRQKVRVAASITRFKSFYGVEPRTIKDAYQSFVDHSVEDDTSLKDFMMLIEWLKKCKSL